MTPGPALRLTAVRKRHHRRGPWVLDGIDLTVGPGQVVQVVGTNGSGKSTLVRLAASLTRPTEGTVAAAGLVTFVPEQTPSPVAMTVSTYLRHQARLQAGRVPSSHGDTPREAPSIADTVDEVIARHRLGPVADRPLRELSKGWGQRAVIAQALLSAPTLCLLDEPFTGVDAASRDHLLGVLEEHAAAGSALVITSHEAMAVHGIDRVHLVAGRITTQTAPSSTTWRVVELHARSRADASDGSTAPLPFADDPAVRRVEERTDGTVAVLVDGGPDGDRFLAEVLTRGWTIERLETRRDR